MARSTFNAKYFQIKKDIYSYGNMTQLIKTQHHLSTCLQKLGSDEKPQVKKEKGRVKTISRIQRRQQVKEISRGRKDIHFFECFQGQLAELKAEAESQLILLDLSVSIDVTVTHQGFPELIQVCPTDAGLQKEFIAVKVLVDLNASNKSLYRLLKQRKVYLKKVPTLLCKGFFNVTE